MQKLAENLRKRNCLCIRWDDQSHQIVSNEAYKRRTNCSEMIRAIVLEQIAKGVAQQQSQA